MRRIPALLAGLALLAPLAAPASAPARPSSVTAKLRGVRAPASQLVPVSVVHSFGATFYRYAQFAGGVPVLNAETVVAIGPHHRGDLVLDNTARRVRAPGHARIGARSAIARARAATRVRSLRAPARATRAILPRGRRSLLVWRVLLPSAAPFADYEVLVDARTGAIVRKHSLLEHFFSGTAAIYDPDPVKEQDSFNGLSDNGDRDSPLLTALRTPVTLENLTNPNCLIGRWVRAVIPARLTREGADYGNSGAINPSSPADVCVPGADFSAITRSDNRFEALMGYFHIDRAQAYIQSLGFSKANGNGIEDRRILVRADYESDDNSQYSDVTKDLTLGVGGVPDGQDAEVFVHEYGHSIQDSESPGFNNGQNFQAGAMGEGFSDYFSASETNFYRPFGGTLTRDGQTAPTPACWSPWDNVGGDPGSPNPGPIAFGPCERRVDETRTPTQLASSGPHDNSEGASDCAGDVHCIGEAWSGALWAIRGQMGAQNTDRLVLQSQFSYTSGTGFDGGSRALIAADRQLYGGADVSFLHGLLCGRQLLRTGC